MGAARFLRIAGLTILLIGEAFGEEVAQEPSRPSSVNSPGGIALPANPTVAPPALAPAPSRAPSTLPPPATPMPSVIPPDGTPAPTAVPPAGTTSSSTVFSGDIASLFDTASAPSMRGPERTGGFGDINNLEPMLNMIGDQGPSPYLLRVTANPLATRIPSPFPPPTLPNAPGGGPARRLNTFVPSVRGFKIAENQSPQPQDRIYFSFNYYDDPNGDLNRRLNSPFTNTQVYREIFGFEKTFADGMGSIGMRVPLNTLSADPTSNTGAYSRSGRTSTALGDLTICAKYILALDPATGSLISGGLAVTPNTGPNSFAGAPYLQTIHATGIQPFLGYIWRRGSFFAHGFLAVDIPTNGRDVTLLYNDFGIGYEVFRSNAPNAFLTAVIPTFEVHVNNPLSHRDYLNVQDPVAMPDVVDLTSGVNFQLMKNSYLTFGVVTPVTGPRPFNIEALLLLNIRFGRSRGAQVPPPMLGG